MENGHKTTSQYHEELDNVLTKLQYEKEHDSWYFILSMLERGFVEENHFIETAAIMLNRMNFNLSLVYNKNAWDTMFSDSNTKLNYQKKIGVTIHEFLHVALDHIFLMEEYDDKRLCNIAADLVVNQSIPKEWIPFGIFLNSFPDFNLEPHKSLNYYYNKLKEHKDDLEKKLNKTYSKGKDDSKNGKIDDKGNGSGNGNGKNISLNKSEKLLDELLSTWDNSHEYWKELFGNLTPEEKEILENNLKSQIETAKSMGSIPGSLVEWLEKRQPVIKENWRKQIRQAIKGNNFSSKKSWTKLNNRFPDNPGLKVKQLPKWLLAIDTSGSMTANSLEEFFSEIDLMAKQTNAEIYIVECDNIIQDVKKYKKKDKYSASGRGGTNFDPAIEYANDVLKPDLLIYYTDGYCTEPTITCKSPILWVLSNDGCNIERIENFQGRKIKINLD